ncbi:MAG: carboxylating nicotinate-nucleotide diphosphorylase [Longimicrobiales bacterium]
MAALTPSFRPLAALVAAALEEDLGDGDRTTLWTVPEGARARARVVAKAPGVIAGTAAAVEVFRQLDPHICAEIVCADGTGVHTGEVVLRISGAARAILSGERTALNFLQRLSGIATLARRFVAAVEGTGARILDTRKTTPGWRALEKAAVRAGGADNHRTGLYDMVLLKENHLAIAGGIASALDRVRARNRGRLPVAVEVRSMAEVAEALGAGAERLLLDNMSVDELREAVHSARAKPGVTVEASGKVSLERVRAVAATGVDFISVGALTHSAPALDLSLLIDLE